MSLHSLVISVAVQSVAAAPGQSAGGIRFSLVRGDGAVPPVSQDVTQNTAGQGYQATFANVEPGVYSVSAQTYDSTGALIGDPVAMDYTLAPDSPATVMIDFPVAGSLSVQLAA